MKRIESKEQIIHADVFKSKISSPKPELLFNSNTKKASFLSRNALSPKFNHKTDINSLLKSKSPSTNHFKYSKRSIDQNAQKRANLAKL